MTSIRLMMIDEVHILGTDRGGILEAIVSRMSIIAKNQDDEDRARIIALSATIPNVGEISEWLNVPNECQFVFNSDFRPVKIQKHVLGYNPSKNDFLFEVSLTYKLPGVVCEYSAGKY